jgi:hypothetical protein
MILNASSVLWHLTGTKSDTQLQQYEQSGSQTSTLSPKWKDTSEACISKLIKTTTCRSHDGSDSRAHYFTTIALTLWSTAVINCSTDDCMQAYIWLMCYCNLFIFQIKITGNLTFWLTFTENGKKCREYVFWSGYKKGSDFSHVNFQSTNFTYEFFPLLLVNYWKLLCLLLQKMTRAWHLHSTSNHTIHCPQVCIIASVTQICVVGLSPIYIYIYIHHKKR